MTHKQEDFIKERIEYYKYNMAITGTRTYKLPRLNMEVKLKEGDTIDDFLKKYIGDSFRVNNNYRRWQ